MNHINIVLEIINIIIYILVFAWSITLLGEKIKFKVGLKYGLIYALFFYGTFLSLYLLGFLNSIIIILISAFIGGLGVYLFGSKIFEDKFIKVGDVATTILLSGLLMGVLNRVIWVVSNAIYYVGQ